MPYASYTYVTDADALAIKAYLFNLPPVHAPARPNALAFPFNQRVLMTFWSLPFNPNKRFEPDSSQSAAWNRGAYLAEALAHCGECHTPRNLAFALDNRRKFGGALTAGWRAYNISSDKGSGIGAWSDDQVFTYLSEGHAMGHGTATGPMGEAVDNSFSQMTPSDIRAMAAYLRTVPADALVHRPQELRVGVGADAGLPVRGDVGRIERPERQGEGEAAGIGFPARRGVADHAVRRLGQVFPALHEAGLGQFGRCAGRVRGMVGGERDLGAGRESHRPGTGDDPQAQGAARHGGDGHGAQQDAQNPHVCFLRARARRSSGRRRRAMPVAA